MGIYHDPAVVFRAFFRNDEAPRPAIWQDPGRGSLPPWVSIPGSPCHGNPLVLLLAWGVYRDLNPTLSLDLIESTLLIKSIYPNYDLDLLWALSRTMNPVY